MNKPDRIEKPSMSGLLDLLRDSGEQQCRALRSEGEARLAELRRKAFARARARVRAAVAEERKRMNQAIGRVEAEVETTLRRRQLAHDQALVEEGRRLLAEALRRRWRDSEARKAWADALLDQAARVVMARQWRIDCPADWPSAEQARTVDRAAELHDARVEVRASESLAAGLKLVSGGLVVDMSLDGVLVDRDSIDGALLDLVRRAQAGEQR